MQHDVHLHCWTVDFTAANDSLDKQQRPWSYKNMPDDPAHHFWPVDFTTSKDSLDE